MRSTKFMGISMTRQSARRTLVVCVYASLVLFIVLLVSVRGIDRMVRAGDFFQAFVWVFVILFTGLSRTIFGALVQQSTFPEPPQQDSQSWKFISLFNPAPFSEGDGADERDISVRNRAYFRSFRWIAVYLAVLWIAYPMLPTSIEGWIPVSVVDLLLLPVLIMAFTLPQALILWSEPDLPMPEEPQRTTAATIDKSR